MATDREVNVFCGRNYRVLSVQGFDRIVFGCPPGLVKDFIRRKDDLPTRFVFPIRTFIKGKNYFDFEFVIYSFLFIKPKHERVSIYCTTDQLDRFKIILDETLYGPGFDQIIRSQFHKVINQSGFSENNKKRFYSFLEKVAADKSLFIDFQNYLKAHVSERKLHLEIQKYFVNQIAADSWLKRNCAPGLDRVLAKNYIICAQLKTEMNLFALTTDENRERFTTNVIDPHIFNEDQSIVIEGNENKEEKLKVVQTKPSVFDVYINDNTIPICKIDISSLDPDTEPIKIELAKKPHMGVTFLGVGSGFAAKRKDSCLIVWSEGMGIMVDALPDSNRQNMRYGISETDIRYSLLTHVHSDHDAGLIEKILQGERIKIISSRIIFDSFLRKVEAITCFPKDVIEGFIDFFEVEPGKTIRLPGFKSTYFTFDYSLHSIPTGRFVLTYKNKKNGSKKVISHSGDTKFDISKINNWYAAGVFTKRRRDAALGFIWDADLVIHDVGGGTLHTDLSSLEQIKTSLAKKTILVHQHFDPVQHPHFRFAWEGQVEELIKTKRKVSPFQLTSIMNVPLFKGQEQNKLLDMLTYSKVVKYGPDEIIFSQNDIGDAFYIILDGFVEVIIDGKSCAIYERGKFFGELAIATANPYRRATIRSRSQLTLLKIPKKYYKLLNLPKIRDDFYKLTDYFNEIISPSLIASLAFGKIKSWKKDDIIIQLGALDKEMYIILSGQVQVVDGENRHLAYLSRGDVVGEVACVNDVPRTATVLACSDEVYAICLQANEARLVFNLFPSFYGTVYKKIQKIEESMAALK